MKKLLLFALFALTLTACTDEDTTHVPGPPPSQNTDKYQGGYYVFNEGSFGHTPGSINYYNESTEEWTLNLFQLNNAEQTLGNTGTVAVCDADNMYLVCKEAPCLVKVGLSDFVKKASVDELPDENQAWGFALLDNSRGVLTTSQSAYIVSLDNLTLTPFHEGDPSSLSGDVAVSGGHIFLIGSANEDHAIMAFDALTLEFVKTVGTARTGFAKTGNAVWAANQQKLVRIDPTDLSSDELLLTDGLSVYYNSMAFTPTGLQASKEGDALYFVNALSDWEGRDVYKFDIGTSAATKIFEAPLTGTDQYSAYGQCVHVHPGSGDLYLVYAKDYGANANIHIVDGDSGIEKKLIPYTDQPYWFPSMLIFR